MLNLCTFKIKIVRSFFLYRNDGVAFSNGAISCAVSCSLSVLFSFVVCLYFLGDAAPLYRPHDKLLRSRAAKRPEIFLQSVMTRPEIFFAIGNAQSRM